jgi:signal transduction histidine kinase/ActR/RegA family two-component response regulator
LDNIHVISGVPYGLIDVQGRILASSGWQEACLNFHQISAESERCCRRSHEILRSKVWAGESTGHECPNGLMHYAMPIQVEGQLLAILTLGQISHQPLDLEHFKARARSMGYEEALYLRALAKVPIIPQAQFAAIQALCRGLADLMASEGLKRLRQRQGDMERAEYLDLILQAVADAVVTVDAKGAINLMNRAAADLLGQDPETSKGLPFNQLFQPRDADNRRRLEDPMRRLSRGDSAAEPGGPALLCLPGGLERLVTFSGILLPDGGAGFAFRDVTQEQRQQEDIQRTARLHSVGVLAGGIAHDFNNLLAAIAGNLSMARLEGGDRAQASQCLTEAETATLRARSLTQQLMTFAKANTPHPQPVNLAALVEEAARLTLGNASQIALEMDAPAGLWPLEADSGQLAQVVNNLVSNAAHAMENHGRLRISLRNQEVQPGHKPVVRPGRYVSVSVQDEGPGLSAAALAHIFEPFYTTKTMGAGAGLGLASALSIIKAHLGDLRCVSEAGQGACFTFWLPAVSKFTGPGTRALAPEASADSATGLRVLVVDDEPMLRDMLLRMLVSMGHQGQAAASGDDGLRAFRQAHALGRDFDLVISDLSMAPGQIGGKQLAREILAVDPQAKILVSSGYSEDPVMSEHENFGFWGCLAKPFNRSDLERVLAMLIKQKA